MSASTKPTRTKHPLKIAGEVQMKKIQHDMTVLRRTNERLLTALRLIAETPRSAPSVPQDIVRVRRIAAEALRELGECGIPDSKETP